MQVQPRKPATILGCILLNAIRFEDGNNLMSNDTSARVPTLLYHCLVLASILLPNDPFESPRGSSMSTRLYHSFDVLWKHLDPTDTIFQGQALPRPASSLFSAGDVVAREVTNFGRNWGSTAFRTFGINRGSSTFQQYCSTSKQNI